MVNVAEEFAKREAAKPDQWTLAWWRQQFAEVLSGYRGATHAINRALAEFEDVNAAIAELREHVQRLESDRDADRALIAELRERAERMAEFLTRLKKGEVPVKS